MTTKELIENLPQKVRNGVEYFREERTNAGRCYDYAVERRDATQEHFYYMRLDRLGTKWIGYCRALVDAGIVNESERKLLYNYGTIPCGSEQARKIHEESD